MNRRGWAGWDEWVDEHLLRFKDMKKAMAGRVFEVSVPDVVAGDFAHIKWIVDQTEGLEWDEQAVKDFIDPNLYGGVK
jgi:hypothetical protein